MVCAVYFRAVEQSRWCVPCITELWTQCGAELMVCAVYFRARSDTDPVAVEPGEAERRQTIATQRYERLSGARKQRPLLRR